MALNSKDPNLWVLGLDRVRSALDLLDHPERDFPHVLVAGTNGKGSVCSYVERIMTLAGLEVGLTTSPHISRFTERFRISGREVDSVEIEMIEDEIRPLIDHLGLTYFEWCTILAVVLFSRKKVAFGIFEIGLGGRYDAANALDPCLSLITSISIDHTNLLGKNVAEIAYEKACIARTDRPLLTAVDGDALRVIEAYAGAVGARHSNITGPVVLATGIEGKGQALNAALAIQACSCLGVTLNEEYLRAALNTAFMPGRLENIGKRVILDVAHNRASMLNLVGCLHERGFSGSGVLGILADKEYPLMAEMLGDVCDRLFLAPVGNPRSWGRKEMDACRGNTTICGSVEEALDRAMNESEMVVVTGSFYCIAEVRDCFICEG